MPSNRPSASTSSERTDSPLPLVSVAIVTYQHRPFIEEAIRSVLGQDYSNLELIVSDDNSTDGTREVLLRLRDELGDDRMSVVTHEGPSSVARNVNRALAQCRGEFVCLFDGDDYLLPGKLSRQVKHMLAHPGCNVCFHAAESFDSDTGAPGAIVGDPSLNDRSTAADITAKGNFLPLCCIMMRASAMPAGGVPLELNFVADWVLLIETTYGGTFDGLDGVYARYRRHPGAITSQTNLKSPVWRESLITMDIVARRHPELHDECRRGRAHVLAWEAYRRARGGAAAFEILPLLFRALLLEPRLGELRSAAGFTRETLAGQRRLLPSRV